MKHPYSAINKGQVAIVALLFLLILFLATALSSVGVGPGAAAGDGQLSFRQQDGTPYYLPIIIKDPTPTPIPTPTATPVPPVPEFVEYIPLPDAKCPNAVGFNAMSGYTYIVNNHSGNLTIFQEREFIANIDTGVWPTAIVAVPDSPRMYITNLHTQVAVVDGLTTVAHIPDYYEPYGVTYNVVNDYAYVSDLDSTVQVISGTSLLTNMYIIDPETGNGAGWLRPIVSDPHTGLVYVASWDYGKMYVIDGTEVVADYRLGWGPLNMAIDAERGYIYIAHADPNAVYPHNLSVFSLETQTVTFLSTAVRSRDVAVDPISGYAYVTNQEDNTITVLTGTQVITTIPAGKTPWGVGVNPNTGYTFVTNRDGRNVTVLKDAAVVTTIDTLGLEPFAVGVDTNTNYVYIANRGDEYGLFECRDASVTILR